MPRLSNAYYLGVKELRSLAGDPVLLGMIAFAFTVGVYAASSVTYELRKARIAIVDQDRSQLTQRIATAFYPPYFRRAQQISWGQEMDWLLDHGQATFVLVFPPSFERDLIAGRYPELQLNVDANTVQYAFIGTGYIRAILARELAYFLGPGAAPPPVPIKLTNRYSFNQNLESSWFTGSMEMVNVVTMLSILLVGAAFLREREQGTLEHLLVMPIGPSEIMVAKIWANGLVVLVTASLSLIFVVQGIIGLPPKGPLLFIATTGIYLMSTTSMGIYLGTLARSMPQFGLLMILTILPLQLLSGSLTPRESMPTFVQNVMLIAPSTHYVRAAQSILFRGAGVRELWPSLAAIVGLGIVFFFLAQRRFRIAVTQTQL